MSSYLVDALKRKNARMASRMGGLAMENLRLQGDLVKVRNEKAEAISDIQELRERLDICLDEVEEL